ncbi:MAG: SdiA-regulated domain-containing protein [Phycisphaerales bacterium]
MLIRAIVLSLAAAAAAHGQVRSFDLGRYRLTGQFDLPPIAAAEASAITFNRTTGNLFIMGDEGDAIVEVTPAGVHVSTMAMTGFDDTEGLTYVGGPHFVLVEERLQDAYFITYTAGGSIDRAAQAVVSIGETVGNVGLEGVCYEPATDLYFFVKEKTPQAVIEADLDFFAGIGAVGNLFNPTGLAALDLSDIQVLSVVPSLAGTPDQDNLLIYSQESSRLMEVSRAGALLSQFSFAGISGNAEGVTIDGDGVVYVCDETPRVYVLEDCYPDCNADGGLTVADFGCFQGRYVLGDAYADCTGDTSFSVADFGCYQGKFVLGCP